MSPFPLFAITIHCNPKKILSGRKTMHLEDQSNNLSEQSEREKWLNGRNNTFLNPYAYLILRKERPSYLANGFFHLFYDGIGLVLLSRLMGHYAKRYSFDDTSLAPLVLKQCVAKGLSLGIVGSAPGIAAEAAKLLQTRYQGLQIAIISDGFYTESAEEELLSRAVICDVVVCSMGTPRQEDFLHKLRRKGWHGTGFTCGGYLDQLVAAQGGDYYPAWMNRLNLRWVYRIAREPRRLTKRYAVIYPLGMAAFCHDLLRRRISI